MSMWPVHIQYLTTLRTHPCALLWVLLWLQVHPAKLTHALMAAAEQTAGAQLVLGTVTGITTAAGAVTGVKVQRQRQQGQEQQQVSAGLHSSSEDQEEELPADVVVLAMGPWTDAARTWLPAAPQMTGDKRNSSMTEGIGLNAVSRTAFTTMAGRCIRADSQQWYLLMGVVFAVGES